MKPEITLLGNDCVCFKERPESIAVISKGIPHIMITGALDLGLVLLFRRTVIAVNNYKVQIQLGT